MSTGATPKTAGREVEGRSAVARLRSFVAPIVKGILHYPERTLHPLRRTAARRSLAEAKPFRSVLFVCHGNVCRSPFAEIVFRELAGKAGLSSDTASSGFVGPDRSPPGAAIAAAARRG